MVIKFESLNNFNKALNEVIILIRRSRKESKYRKISNVYLKSALILLTAKFEAFIENIVGEYIGEINQKVQIENIPEIFKIIHTKGKLKEFYDCFNNIKEISKREKICEYMKDLAFVWNDIEFAPPLKISNKFNYGKHGQESMNELFHRIGFDDILNEIKIYEIVMTLDGEEQQEINFVAKFNEMTGKRNSILHNDSSIMFTEIELLEYINYLKQFSIKLDEKLSSSIDLLIVES